MCLMISNGMILVGFGLCRSVVDLWSLPRQQKENNKCKKNKKKQKTLRTV